VTGIAYDITNKNIGRYQKENNIPSIYSPRPPLESFMLPLAFEPGTSWVYGMGIDWAGIMVARLSGLDLEEYFKAHIWKCCDITTISFIPPKDWDAIGMQTTTRDPPNNGRIQISKENTLGRDVHQDFGPIYTGGGGLFGTARDYLRFLRGVLRSADPELKEEERLLSPGMFKLMFTDTLPDLPQVKKSLRDFVVGGQIYDRPQELHENEVGYAPGSFIVKRDTDLGRKAMSGTWEGMSKTYHWLDPATGIAVRYIRPLMCCGC
jgi:methyl acetate hydrolase